MKYRLKDRALQKKLDEISGDFSEELKANVRKQIESLHGILKRIENDLNEDDPVAAGVRADLAKRWVGILFLSIKEWERKED